MRKIALTAIATTMLTLTAGAAYAAEPNLAIAAGKLPNSIAPEAKISFLDHQAACKAKEVGIDNFIVGGADDGSRYILTVEDTNPSLNPDLRVLNTDTVLAAGSSDCSS